MSSVNGSRSRASSMSPGRSVSRSPAGRRSGANLSPWGSYVDSLVVPPPPPGLNDYQRARWEAKHRGLYDRMRTAASWPWVGLLLALFVVFYLVGQVFQRRSWDGPSLSANILWILSGLCLLRAGVLAYNLYSLQWELNSLTHLTNNQRRLLGLPEVPDAPATPLRQRSARPPSGAQTPSSASRSIVVGGGSTSGSRSAPHTPTESPFSAGRFGSARHSPYSSPIRPGFSPHKQSSSSVVRARQLGLDGGSGRYCVSDAMALDELVRLQDPDALPEQSATGVLLGSSSRAGLSGGIGPLGSAGGVHPRHHPYLPGYRKESRSGIAGGEVVGFDSLESVFGIRPEALDIWSSNLRRFISRHIVTKLLDPWYDNIHELSAPDYKLSREFLNRRVPTISIPLQGTFTLQEVLLRFQDDPRYISKTRRDPKSSHLHINLLHEKLLLERYVDVRGEQWKSYVIHRLETLSADEQLWRYSWDGGGEWEGQPWAAERGMPTDAQILVHYFNTMMDTFLSEKSSRYHSSDARSAHVRLFSSKYCVTGTKHMPPGTALNVASTHPMHLRVIHERIPYNMPEGRLNVFYALSMFVHLVKRNHKGELEGVDLMHLCKPVLDTSELY